MHRRSAPEAPGSADLDRGDAVALGEPVHRAGRDGQVAGGSLIPIQRSAASVGPGPRPGVAPVSRWSATRPSDCPLLPFVARRYPVCVLETMGRLGASDRRWSCLDCCRIRERAGYGEGAQRTRLLDCRDDPAHRVRGAGSRAMLFFYALESRSPWSVLAFAGAVLRRRHTASCRGHGHSGSSSWSGAVSPRAAGGHGAAPSADRARGAPISRSAGSTVSIGRRQPPHTTRVAVGRPLGHRLRLLGARMAAHQRGQRYKGGQTWQARTLARPRSGRTSRVEIPRAHVVVLRAFGWRVEPNPDPQ